MLFLFVALFLLNACSYFDEEEIKLPGKRVDVFEKKSQKLIKSKKSVILPKPKEIKNWPLHNHNVSNNLTHFLSNKKLKIKWEKEASYSGSKNDFFVAKPIIYKNKIYSVLANSIISVRDAISGKKIWEKKLIEESDEEIFFTGGVGINDDTLFVSSGIGNLYSINLNTREINWKKSFSSPVSAPPLIFSNKVIVITDDNQTIALEKFNGQEIWSHSGSLENVSIIGGVSPSMKDNALYVTYTSGEIFALNSENGSILWFENIALGTISTRNLIFDIQSSPVIHKDKLLVSSYINKFLAMSLTDGEKMWEIELSTINPITTAGDYIYLLDTENKLHCIELTDGTIVWTVQLKNQDKKKLIRWVGPLLTSNQVIIASSEGVILSISPFNGKILGQINTDHDFITNPILSNKSIFFTTKKGKLLALE